MRLFKKIVKYTGLLWAVCFTVVLLSKNRDIDEFMMVLSILSSYLFAILGVSYLLVSLILKLRSKLSERDNYV